MNRIYVRGSVRSIVLDRTASTVACCPSIDLAEITYEFRAPSPKFVPYCFEIISKSFRFISKIFSELRENVSLFHTIIHRCTSASRLKNNALKISGPYSTHAQMCPCKLDHVSSLCKRDLNKPVE